MLTFVLASTGVTELHNNNSQVPGTYQLNLYPYIYIYRKTRLGLALKLVLN